MAPSLWMVAEFIRRLGYNAIPAANDTALSIPLAVDAGLGQAGRHGLLINPKVGARCRISKIFTDLPLEPAGAVDSGITEFCNACLKCVPEMRPEVWHQGHHDRRAKFRAIGRKQFDRGPFVEGGCEEVHDLPEPCR